MGPIGGPLGSRGSPVQGAPIYPTIFGRLGSILMGASWRLQCSSLSAHIVFSLWQGIPHLACC